MNHINEITHKTEKLTLIKTEIKKLTALQIRLVGGDLVNQPSNTTSCGFFAIFTSCDSFLSSLLVLCIQTVGD